MKVDLVQIMKEKLHMIHQHHLLDQKKNRTLVNLNPLFYHLVDSQYDQVVFPYQI
jgi:hypothetical protein